MLDLRDVQRPGSLAFDCPATPASAFHTPAFYFQSPTVPAAAQGDENPNPQAKPAFYTPAAEESDEEEPMGPPASSPSVAPSWSNSDLVLHHLSVADQLQRQHVAKGGGEAPVATLFAALLDRTGLFSGKRAVLQECYKLLSQQVQAAMYGEFASVPFPASFATQIFDRYFGAEPHRKAEFYKRVEAYVPVQGFANAERHVRDKASGALRRVSSSVGLGHLAAQIQGVQRSAFDDLTQRLDMATDEVRRLRDDLHACSDVPPAARKYSSEEIRDMHDLVARASLELQQYVSTCSEDPAFMRVWQELKAAASTQSTGATSAGPSQQGSPSGGGHQGDGAAASPSLSRDSPPPGLTAARPGADPTPAATAEQPAAAVASTPADPAGSEASDAEDGSSLSSSDERIERLRVLNGELRSNQSQLRAMKAAAEAWGEWHSAVERRNHISGLYLFTFTSCSSCSWQRTGICTSAASWTGTAAMLILLMARFRGLQQHRARLSGPLLTLTWVPTSPPA